MCYSNLMVPRSLIHKENQWLSPKDLREDPEAWEEWEEWEDNSRNQTEVNAARSSEYV